MAEPTPAPAPPALARDPAFVRLWTATTASGLATWALPFVLGLALAERELSATGLGLVLAARTAGFLAAVPIGGVLADRYPRRTVVLVSGLAAAVATPVIALGLDGATVVMAAAAAIVGAGQGACRPAFQALTAEVVAAERRQGANAAITFAVRVTTLAAPGLTVLAAVFLDISGLLLATAALWLVAALMPPRPARTGPVAARSGTDATVPRTSWKWRVRAASPGTGTPRRREAVAGVDAARGLDPTTPFTSAPRPGFFAEFADGVREARRHPWFLAGLAALTAVVATGYSATSVVLPLVSRDRYGSEAVLAAGTTAYIVGALIGALLIARWRPKNQGWTALAALACYGFAPLSLMLPVPAGVVIGAYVIAGLGIELFNVPWFTATQREVEPGKLARVSSLDFMLSYGLAPVGLALIAPAVTTFGAVPVLGVCVAACVAVPALAMLVPSSRHFARERRSVSR